jgi:excinuclease ABC subunit C
MKAITLKDKLKNLPKKPGVYIYRNSKGKIIYIGKALSLKHRVSSYFQGKHDAKTTELVVNIADLEYIIVNSEFEALLLEARLIKQHEPKYNIIQKDNKSYLYIVIGKQFPNRIYTARWAELSEPLDSWYGPFPSSTDAKIILKYIRRIFPFRSCKTLPKKTCLYKDLKLCSGVCVQDDKMIVNIEQSDYQRTVRQIKLILSGKISTLLKSLIKEMKIVSKSENYEEAQIIKNQIDSLTALTIGWRSVPREKRDNSKTILDLRKLLVKHQGFDPITINKIEGYDVSNLGHDIIVGSMVAFVDGEPENGLYRKFNLKYNLVSQDDPEGIKQIIRRRLNHPEWIYPQLIVIDGGKTQVSAAFEAIKDHKLLGQISLVGITKEFETLIIPRIQNEIIIKWNSIRLSRRSPELQLLQSVRDESHRFAQRYYKEQHKRNLMV